MSSTPTITNKSLQWRLECLAHTMVEWLAGMLPGPWVFRLGECLGGLAWHFFPKRRAIVMRNLRVAFAGQKNHSELEDIARASFRRAGANLISAAHTARLTPSQLRKAMRIERIDLLENALASGRGVVLLLAHMGNWEVLSRLGHFFPAGSKTGAFYRPLNNVLLDAHVLARRQADGTRMFSKRDPFHQVTGFLRDGGIVGVLADQRVGIHGELVQFFGRTTRASPLPSLLARRSKSDVLALSVVTEAPGKWLATFSAVESPYTTAHCMAALEQAMSSGCMDVFWMQERWKVYVGNRWSIDDWLEKSGSTKPHRAVVWLAGIDQSWQLRDGWTHPDVTYQAVVSSNQPLPSWLPPTTRVHEVANPEDLAELSQLIAALDAADPLPLDFIVTPRASKTLCKAAKQLAVPVISLP